MVGSVRSFLGGFGGGLFKGRADGFLEWERDGDGRELPGVAGSLRFPIAIRRLIDAERLALEAREQDALIRLDPAPRRE